jgi:AcrR family transcriptional regulator
MDQDARQDAAPTHSSPYARRSGRPSLGGGKPVQGRELRTQGRETLRRLLEAGVVEFEERGFPGARVDDMVKRAGISHGTFYLYFANKEDLFQALMQDALYDLEIVADDFPVVTRDEAGRQALRTWVRRFFRAYAMHGTVLRTLSAANAPGEVAEAGLRLLFGLVGTMTTEMTAAIRDQRQPAEHVELTAVACLMMLERVNYLITTEVELPQEEMADRISDIIYAAFTPRR